MSDQKPTVEKQITCFLASFKRKYRATSKQSSRIILAISLREGQYVFKHLMPIPLLGSQGIPQMSPQIYARGHCSKETLMVEQLLDPGNSDATSLTGVTTIDFYAVFTLSYMHTLFSPSHMRSFVFLGNVLIIRI